MSSTTLYLLQPRAPISESLSVIMAGHDVEFVPAFLRDGAVVMATVLPEGDAGKDVLKLARRMRNVYTVVSEGHGIEWQNRPPKGVRLPVLVAEGKGLPKPVEVAPMIRAALHNGWTSADLEGAGTDEQWGPDGGLSATTGLTMADMALCTPPPAWDKLRDTRWPWQVAGFKPPGDGWIHPILKDKDVPDAADPESVEAEAKAAEVAANPVIEVVDDDQPLPDNPEKLLSEFSQEQKEKAIVILAKLIHAAGGERPTYNKLNYRLRKAGLPTVGQDELAALITMYESNT